MTRRRSAVLVVGAGWFLTTLLIGCGGGADDRPVITAGDATVGATGTTVAAAYLTLHNGGSTDRLVGVASPDATSVTMHGTESLGSATAMVTVESLEVPAAGTLRFEPGGDHLMLEGLHAPVRAGDVIRIRLDFERAGRLEVTATAVPLQDLPERIDRR